MIKIEMVSADRIGMGDFQETAIQGLFIDSAKKELVYVKLDDTGRAILIKVE
ncbi:MAG TPA: hypothetical protein PLE04_11570 [Syntrophales bacterium]|nr:hypothetical protein [Syntrophales bacterium]